MGNDEQTRWSELTLRSYIDNYTRHIETTAGNLKEISGEFVRFLERFASSKAEFSDTLDRMESKLIDIEDCISKSNGIKTQIVSMPSVVADKVNEKIKPVLDERLNTITKQHETNYWKYISIIALCINLLSAIAIVFKLFVK